MSARKTESRIPENFQPADLGQTVAAADGRSVLVSFISAPLVVGRPNDYVVFVTDPVLAAAAQSFAWTLAEEAAAPVTETTDKGTISYRPQATGILNLTVRILDNADTEIANLTMVQEVVNLNVELESLITQADEVTAIAADPEISREIVNDVRGYMDELAPRTADSDSSLNKLLFAIAYAEAMQIPAAARSEQTESIAFALNEGAANSFADQSKTGVGLCQVRPQILAMFLSATAGGTDWLIAPREFSNDVEARDPIRKELEEALAQLDEARRIDLFNLLRFPKSNLNMTVKLLEALRAQYFPGEALPAILNDQDKAKTLISQFKEGPFALS